MSEEKQEIEVRKSGAEQRKGLQRNYSDVDEMERIFDDFFQKRFFAPSWIPRLKFPEFADVSTSVDMFEEGDDLVIKAGKSSLVKVIFHYADPFRSVD